MNTATSAAVSLLLPVLPSASAALLRSACQTCSRPPARKRTEPEDLPQAEVERRARQRELRVRAGLWRAMLPVAPYAALTFVFAVSAEEGVTVPAAGVASRVQLGCVPCLALQRLE